jgi:hypothetical protein
MRNADTMLGVIRERGRRRLPLENLDRQLYNRNLYLQAHGRLLVVCQPCHEDIHRERPSRRKITA